MAPYGFSHGKSLQLMLLGFLCVSLTNASISSHWLCHDGDVIPYKYRCDQVPDCHDRSDELNCQFDRCPDGHQHCDSEEKCIPIGLVCNGQWDCQGGTDEMACVEPDKCTDRYFFCDGECLPLEWRCDGDIDCLDQSDEKNCPFRTCLTGEVRCNSTNSCIPEIWLCDGDGDCDVTSQFQSHEDEMNCPVVQKIFLDLAIDVEPKGCLLRKNLTIWNKDLYQNEVVCDQVCHVTANGPVCSCIVGYSEVQNEHSSIQCKVLHDFPMLFYVSDNRIVRREMSEISHEEVIVHLPNSNQRILSMDYHSASNTLIWADSDAGVIHSLQVSSNKTDSVKVSRVAGIALDWISFNLYVTQRPSSGFGGQVGVIPVSKVNEENEVFKLADFRDPISIAVHPFKRIMLIVNRGKESSVPSTIVLSEMDGRSPTIFAVESDRIIHYVTIDYVTDVAYWSESNSLQARIEMKSLDQSQTRVVAKTKNKNKRTQTLLTRSMNVVAMRSPFALSVFEDRLVFGDNETGEIWEVESMLGKPGGFPVRHEPIVKDSQLASRLLAFKVAHQSLQPVQDSPCANSGCSHACVLRVSGYTCLCPANLVLDADGKKCIGEPVVDASTQLTTQEHATISSAVVPSSTDNTPPINNIFNLPTAAPTVPKSTTPLASSTSTTTATTKTSTQTVPTCPYPNIGSRILPDGATYALLMNNKFEFGDTMQFKCMSGTHAIGNPLATTFSVMCLSTGSWNRKVIDCATYTCQELDCGRTGGKCIAIEENVGICQCDNGELATSCHHVISDDVMATATVSITTPVTSSITASPPSRATTLSSPSEIPANLSISSDSERSPNDIMGGLISMYVPKIVGVVVALIIVGCVAGFIVFQCLKRTRRSMDVHYSAQPRRKWRVQRNRANRRDAIEEVPEIDNNNCITNPNYSSPRTTKVRLSLPDEMVDSGVDRSSSSISSSESPRDQQRFGHMVLPMETDSVEELQNMDIIYDQGRPERSGIRSAIHSVFHIRKSESREQMLPRS